MRMFALTKVFVCLLAAWGILDVGSANANAEVVTNGWVKPSNPQNPAGRLSYDAYRVRLTAGVTYTIDLSSDQFDPYLIIVGPNGMTMEDDAAAAI